MTYDPEIEKLLPWYVKGLLEADDLQKVERYLAAHPDMASQLELIDQEARAVEQQHAALGAPMPGGLDRLLADIDMLERQGHRASHSDAASLAERLKGFWANFSSPAVRFTGAAAAFVIVAQTVLIGSMMAGGAGKGATPAISSFTTAAGPQERALNTAAQADWPVFLVVFKPDATIEAISDLLQSLSAKVIAGPMAGGFYKIAIAKEQLPADGEAGVLALLTAQSELVKFAAKGQ